MIKIAATISKKVPLPGIDFSSQAYGASMEVEVSDGDDAQSIKIRITELYSLLSESINDQIAASQSAPLPATQPAQQRPVNRLPAPSPQQRLAAPQNGYPPAPINGRQTGANGAANGNGKRPYATQAQQRAIWAICKAQNLNVADVIADFNVADVSELHVKDASQLIDRLKSNGVQQQ